MPATQTPTVSICSTSSNGSSGGPSPRGWGLDPQGGADSRAPSSPVTLSRTMPEFCMAWCSRFSRLPSLQQGSSSGTGGCRRGEGCSDVGQAAQYRMPTLTYPTGQTQARLRGQRSLLSHLEAGCLCSHWGKPSLPWIQAHFCLTPPCLLLFPAPTLSSQVRPKSVLVLQEPRLKHSLALSRQSSPYLWSQGFHAQG
jgi:hypothetical protein